MAEGIYRYTPLWGEWNIDSLIGKGSYGEVYKIYKIEDGKRIEAAAKYISIPKNDENEKNLLRQSYTENELPTYLDKLADRYSIEISSMLKLKNEKNVVHYEDHIKEKKKDEPGWDIIIRMELLTPLKGYLEENSLSKKDVVKLGIDICSAIEGCQKNNVIHRDIKPENIFIDADGNYKLGDFGVSKFGAGTATGTVTGTEDYMAPEISRGKHYNNTVDIYSLGMAMYRLLNNDKIPFINADYVPGPDEISIAQQKRKDGVRLPPPKYGGDKLSKIILKACAYNRHNRYSSPAEMSDKLKNLLETIDDSPVLEARKNRNKFSKTGTGETVSDIPVTDGGRTESDVINPDKDATITDISSAHPKRKKLIIVGSMAASICVIGIIIGYVAYLNMQPVPATNILSLPSSTQLVVGDSFQLSPKIYPSDADGTISYLSENEDIAKVNDKGEITAVSAGTTTITVYSGDIKKKVDINISEKFIPISDITVVKSVEMTVGDSSTYLGVKIDPENATEQKLLYTSSDTNIVTVDENGAITPVADGQAEITVSAGDITKTVPVTVNKPPEQVVVKTPPKPPTVRGKKVQPAETPPATGSNGTEPGGNAAAAQEDTAPKASDEVTQHDEPNASGNQNGGGNSGREIANPDGDTYY